MKRQRARAGFLVGAAIGSGTTALAAERGGVDFLLAINAGRLRNMGAPSIACMLPIFDASRLTEDFARRELLTQCRVPVLLGVDVWSARFDPGGLAARIRDAGFAGAVNFPSCMHYSRPMQQILARAGRGIEQEVEQLRAVQDAGLTAMFYCATRTQARLGADAGLDMVCLNLGWNVGGAIGHRRRASIEEVATVAREIGRLVRRINPATRFLLEGGPIATAEDLGRVVGLARIDGYVGGSTIERIPLENSVADQIDRFRRAGLGSGTPDAETARLLSWAGRYGFCGHGKTQIAFLRRLRAVAPASAPAMVVAEPGIDLRPVLSVLEANRGAGARREAVHIDVAAEKIPAHARSLLFGHRDTLERQPPALSEAAAGVLVIRSPERLPPSTQLYLARALRDGRFRVTGTRRTLPVSPRVILVCDIPVSGERAESELAAAGLDRDLLAAVRGWILRVPPLRERIDDLPAVIERILADIFGGAGARLRFSVEVRRRLYAHRWPGNEAEVRALLGALAGRPSTEPVQLGEIESLLGAKGADSSTIGTEKELIVDALWRHGFNRTRTAASLGMSRKTLYNKIRKYGLVG